MTVRCNSCGTECEDYRELALHISTSKTGHRKGKRWAAKYISRHVINKRTIEYNGRTPLTAEQRANREDTRYVLSGERKVADTVCPKCKKSSRDVLEAEYVSSPQAWKMQGRLAKLCDDCG